MVYIIVSIKMGEKTMRICRIHNLAVVFMILTLILTGAASASGLESFVGLFDMKNVAMWHLNQTPDNRDIASALHDVNKRLSSEIDEFVDDCRGEMKMVQLGHVITAVNRVDSYLLSADSDYADIALGELISDLADRARSSSAATISNEHRDVLNGIISRQDYVSLKTDSFYLEPAFSSYVRSLRSNPERSMWFMEEVSGQAEIWYFDDDGNLVKEKVRAGARLMNGRFTVRSVDSGEVNIVDSNGRRITLGLISATAAPEGMIFTRNNTVKLVPAFGTADSYSIEEGGTVNVYLKVLRGTRLDKNAVLRARNRDYRADDRGYVKISWRASELSSTERSYVVTLKSDPSVSIVLKLKRKTRVAMWNHMGFIGGSAAVGLSPGIAELSISAGAGHTGSAFILGLDARNSRKDSLTLSFRPNLELGVTGTIGPKLRLFKLDVLGKNLGAEAGAYVGATVKINAAFNQSYMFPQPKNREQVKAQVAILSHQLMQAASPAVGMLLKPAIEKVTRVRFDDYMSQKAFWLTSSLRIYGSVKAYLGLKDGPEDDSNTQAHLTLADVNAGLTFSGTIQGGVAGGIDTVSMQPMPQKYFVTLKSDVTGDFNASFLAMKILKLPLPSLFKDSRKATCTTSMTFRFDKQKRMEKAFIAVAVGHEIYGWSAMKQVREIATWLRNHGGTASDMAEIVDIKGMVKTVIFIIDRDDTEKYFSEWSAFSKALLAENKKQNEGKVIARVKGLTKALGEVIKRMADVPIPYIMRTSMTTDLTKPSFNLDVSLGVKVKLGINSVFSKSKIYTSESGTLSRFKFYPEKQYNYDVLMARSDREITELLGVWKDFVGQEIKEAAGYVWKKAKDGTIYIINETAEAVYIIKKKIDGTVEVICKAGEEAKDFLVSVWDSIGTGWNYVSDGASYVASGIGDAVSDAWNWIWD